MKGAILDWIVPRGDTLDPPLARNVKTDRGFHHERTGALLCPTGLDWSNIEYVIRILRPCCLTTFRVKEKLRSGEMVVSGDQWPIFLYDGYRFNPKDPWRGIFRSRLLVSVSLHLVSEPNYQTPEPLIICRHTNMYSLLQVLSIRRPRQRDLAMPVFTG